MVRILPLFALFLTNTLYAASFLGVYNCTGYDPYLDKNYTGTITVRQQNTVYAITMEYDTGEEYRATGGQYNEELMSVVFQDTHDLTKVGLEQYHFSDDRNVISGYWVYLGDSRLGKETCARQQVSNSKKANKKARQTGLF